MSKLTEELRASLARPLTPAQKIEKAYRAAETDEERAEIRALATEEMDFADGRDELVAILNATGVTTYEQDMDRGQRLDRQLATPQIDPPTYESPEIMAQLTGLDGQFEAGYIGRAEYARRQVELTAELQAAGERDDAMRAAYDQAVRTGSWTVETHPKLRGVDLSGEAHGQYHPEEAAVHLYRHGTPENPALEAVIEGSGEFLQALDGATSKAEVMAAVRQYGAGAGLVADDEPATRGRPQ
jgi:hypothetical protein